MVGVGRSVRRGGLEVLGHGVWRFSSYPPPERALTSNPAPCRTGHSQGPQAALTGRVVLACRNAEVMPVAEVTCSVTSLGAEAPAGGEKEGSRE